MAECRRFVCKGCSFIVEAWSDGNPYYYDEQGKKRYAYHPDHENLDKCIGNDSPHICLTCSEEFNVDSRVPMTQCPKCNSESIVDTYHLAGNTCPKCKKDVFEIDPNFFAVS